MKQNLVMKYCSVEDLWKATVENKTVRVCVEKVDQLFGKQCFSKSLNVSFSDEPTKKKGEKTFRYVYTSIGYKGKYIPTYASLMLWIEKSFPALLSNDKLYVKVSQ